MKLVSTLSLGVALSLGMVAVTGTAPAVAAKKEKAPAAAPAPNFKLGKAFRAAIGPAQAAVKAGNFAAAKTAIDAADAAATVPDEKYVASAVRLELATAQKDPAAQSKAVYGMLASGSAPAADLPKLNFYAGNFAYNAGDYPNAVRYLTEADRLGNKTTDVLLLLAEAHFKSNQVPTGLSAVERAIAGETAAGRKAPESWYQRAASVSYKAKLNGEVAKWTRAQVRAYPTAENWRSALVTFRDSQKMEGQPMLDLFRLMRTTKSLKGERDYFEYAAAASERGLPGEAKAVIEEGFTLGTVPRSSRAVNEILTMSSGKVAGDRASLAGSERQAGSAANGRLAANTADAFLGYGDDAKAITLYRTALQKGQVDTDAVNTRLGIALARSGQKEEARKVFTTVTGARAEIAKFWMLWLDTAA
jgi:hypothetical protein